MLNIVIDEHKISAKSGETILQAARRNGLYIPTMCYLSKVKPIASCRLCVVKVEGVDGFILSCQALVVDGMVVQTNSKELYLHRQNIMKLYGVNHPLECGVCDKSGSCDLQNKTLEFGIDSQEFSAKEHKRDIRKWDFIGYDESLCILCEKCVHVCNEIIGDDAIEIVYGGYGSKIAPKETRELECTNCGECIAVCPVGAMISTGFQYSTNSWELERVPATCAHCSGGCALYYERKHSGALNRSDVKIYRVTNESEFTTLCGAGRFGFDFENRVLKKDKEAFAKAVKAFKRADSIRFTSRITNEEALILQRLKDRYGFRLINADALNFSNFLNNYSSVTGKSLYGGTLEKLADSDGVIVIGTKILTDNPAVRYHITMASKRHNARVVYMHPIEDLQLKNVVTQFVKYEVGTEEGVLAMLAKTLLGDKIKVGECKEYFEALDEGYLSAESNVGEEELEEIYQTFKRCKKVTLVIGEDCFNHHRVANIAKLAALFERFGDMEVLPVAPKTNTLGVSLICSLDEEQDGYTVGYDSFGDFVLSSSGDGDIDMPALNQQEGTFVNIDKRVVPTNAAIEYGGYTLSDIANALGEESEFTIDFTSQLPKDKGFKEIAFDDIPYAFSNSEGELRGYELERVELQKRFKLDEVDELPEFNGPIIYRCDPVLHFGPQTARCSQLGKDEPVLIGSRQFSIAAKISDGDRVKIRIGEVEMQRLFTVDPDLKGTIALNPTFDLGLSEDLLSSLYRFSQGKIEVTGQSDE